MKILIIIISVITVVTLMAPPTWAQKFNDNGGKNIAGVDYIDPAKVTASASSEQGNGSTAAASSNKSNLDSDYLVANTQGNGRGQWHSNGVDVPMTIRWTFDKNYQLKDMWLWNSNQPGHESDGRGIRDVEVWTDDGNGFTQLTDSYVFTAGPHSNPYRHDMDANGEVCPGCNEVNLGGASLIAVELRMTKPAGESNYGTGCCNVIEEVRFNIGEGKQPPIARSEQLAEPTSGRSNQEEILQGHTDVVLDVTFSPDGSKLASVSRDQTVRIWDCTSLTMTTDVPSDTDGTRNVPVTVLRGHKESIYSVCISKDGQVLAAASWMGEVRIWSLPSGELLQTLQAHRQGVTCVAIAPDSQFLATGGADKSVKLWNVADGQLLGTLQGHTSGVLHVDFSLDGTALASAGLDTTVKLWDRQDLKVLKTLTGHSGGGGNFPHPGYVNCIAYASDSRTLASASHDKSVRLWNILATEEESPTVLTGHTDTISSVAISPSDARIASGSFDRSIRLWHGTTGEVIHVLTGHTGEVTAVTFSPDGQWLASASFDHTVRLWKMKPDN